LLEAIARVYRAIGGAGKLVFSTVVETMRCAFRVKFVLNGNAVGFDRPPDGENQQAPNDLNHRLASKVSYCQHI
jgi:hypothetical protein